MSRIDQKINNVETNYKTFYSSNASNGDESKLFDDDAHAYDDNSRSN